MLCGNPKYSGTITLYYTYRIYPKYWNTLTPKGHPRGRFGRKSLPKLADFFLSWAEGEVKMYRMNREIQNSDQNFSLKLSQNFSLSESSRMTPVLKFKKKSLFYYLLKRLQQCWMSGNRVDPDQLPHSVASDVGLHCLLRHVCPNI